MKILLFVVLFSFFSSANAGICVKLVTGGRSGSLEPTSQSIADCTDLVLFSKDEYTQSTSLTDILTMSKDDYEQLAKAFLILLSLAVSIKMIMRQLMP
jgi:hypothetical protein